MKVKFYFFLLVNFSITEGMESVGKNEMSVFNKNDSCQISVFSDDIGKEFSCSIRFNNLINLNTKKIKLSGNNGEIEGHKLTKEEIAGMLSFKNIFQNIDRVNKYLYEEDQLILVREKDLIKFEDYFYLTNCIKSEDEIVNFVYDANILKKMLEFVDNIGIGDNHNEIKMGTKNYYLSKLVCLIIKMTLIENYIGSVGFDEASAEEYKKIYRRLKFDYNYILRECKNIYMDANVNFKLLNGRLMGFYKNIIVRLFSLFICEKLSSDDLECGLSELFLDKINLNVKDVFEIYNAIFNLDGIDAYKISKVKKEEEISSKVKNFYNLFFRYIYKERKVFEYKTEDGRKMSFDELSRYKIVSKIDDISNSINMLNSIISDSFNDVNVSNTIYLLNENPSNVHILLDHSTKQGNDALNKSSSIISQNLYRDISRVISNILSFNLESTIYPYIKMFASESMLSFLEKIRVPHKHKLVNYKKCENTKYVLRKRLSDFLNRLAICHEERYGYFMDRDFLVLEKINIDFNVKYSHIFSVNNVTHGFIYIGQDENLPISVFAVNMQFINEETGNFDNNLYIFQKDMRLCHVEPFVGHICSNGLCYFDGVGYIVDCTKDEASAYYVIAEKKDDYINLKRIVDNWWLSKKNPCNIKNFCCRNNHSFVTFMHDGGKGRLRVSEGYFGLSILNTKDLISFDSYWNIIGFFVADIRKKNFFVIQSKIENEKKNVRIRILEYNACNKNTLSLIRDNVSKITTGEFFITNIDIWSSYRMQDKDKWGCKKYWKGNKDFCRYSSPGYKPLSFSIGEVKYLVLFVDNKYYTRSGTRHDDYIYFYVIDWTNRDEYRFNSSKGCKVMSTEGCASTLSNLTISENKFFVGSSYVVENFFNISRIVKSPNIFSNNSDKENIDKYVKNENYFLFDGYVGFPANRRQRIYRLYKNELYGKKEEELNKFELEYMFDLTFITRTDDIKVDSKKIACSNIEIKLASYINAKPISSIFPFINYGCVVNMIVFNDGSVYTIDFNSILDKLDKLSKNDVMACEFFKSVETSGGNVKSL